KQIIRLKLGKIQRRMAEAHRLALDYDAPLVDAVAERCTEVESGARNIDNILTNTLLPELSRMLLSEIVEGRKPSRIAVSVGEEGGVAYRLDEPQRVEMHVPVVPA